MSELSTLIDSLRDAVDDHDWYDVGVLLGHVADRIERLEGDNAWGREQHAIARVLGKALGYPAADDGTVCTGEHSALSLATEADGRIGVLTAEVERLRAENAALAAEWLWQPEMTPELVALRDRAIEEHRGKAGTSGADPDAKGDIDG